MKEDYRKAVGPLADNDGKRWLGTASECDSRDTTEPQKIV
jgi:hypothetical protein